EDASAASIDPTTSSGRATSCHAPPAQRLATGRVGPSSLSAPPNTQTLRLPDAATASSPSPPGWGRVSTTRHARPPSACPSPRAVAVAGVTAITAARSEEHTSELQSRENLVCRLQLEKKKTKTT